MNQSEVTYTERVEVQVRTNDGGWMTEPHIHPDQPISLGDGFRKVNVLTITVTTEEERHDE
jgi:hypothetical protein